MRGAALVSASSTFPRNSVPTAEIAKRVGVDSNWLVKRTGVRRRHRAGPEERLSDLGAAAALRALDQATVRAEDVDLIVVATMTPGEGAPTVAPLIADTIGARGAGAIDVSCACSGFLSALVLAAGQIEVGRADTVVVVGGDLMSKLLDYDDRVTAGIFGDGVGAVVVRAIDGPSRIGPSVLAADGTDANAIVAAHPYGPIRMDGRRTFQRAVACLVDASQEALRRSGLTIGDIDLFVPHQANARITKAVGERLGICPELVVDCIANFGNTTGGTLPIALSYAYAQRRLREGSRVLLAAFGAGLAWGSVVVTWGMPPEPSD